MLNIDEQLERTNHPENFEDSNECYCMDKSVRVEGMTHVWCGMCGGLIEKLGEDDIDVFEAFMEDGESL